MELLLTYDYVLKQDEKTFAHLYRIRNENIDMLFSELEQILVRSKGSQI